MAVYDISKDLKDGEDLAIIPDTERLHIKVKGLLIILMQIK